MDGEMCLILVKAACKAVGRAAPHSRDDVVKNKIAIWEIVAVVLTALLHPVFVEILHQRAIFIILALLGWLSYLAIRCWRHKNALAALGLRKEGYRPTLIATSVFGVIAFAAMVKIAIAHHRLLFRWEMLPLLFLYPVWGMLQQLLVQGIFVKPLSDHGFLPNIVVALAASVLFAAVHMPDLRLAGATFLMGAVFTVLYLRWRNLWPLGVCHGWLGVFYYYWILERNPWAEIFRGG
ncbi:MAG: hypothetical protein C5B50_02045 [Verrucomicrobia bacterium]|nr:MAG: hypothetical protein C5B50_02045 [Verrucomicrobiota bacterium]